MNPTSFVIPIYVSTRLQSGDGKTCRGCVVVASSFPWMNPGANLKKTILTENTLYVNTRISWGGYNACRGCVVVASSIPWMNPGVNLKKTILTENTLYVNTRLQSGGEKSPESTQNRFNGFLTMKGRQCQSTPTLAS
jgi:hypothetical protein